MTDIVKVTFNTPISDDEDVVDRNTGGSMEIMVDENQVNEVPI
jgi:hypothetical protein